MAIPVALIAALLIGLAFYATIRLIIAGGVLVFWLIVLADQLLRAAVEVLIFPMVAFVVAIMRVGGLVLLSFMLILGGAAIIAYAPEQGTPRLTLG